MAPQDRRHQRLLLSEQTGHAFSTERTEKVAAAEIDDRVSVEHREVNGRAEFIEEPR